MTAATEPKTVVSIREPWPSRVFSAFMGAGFLTAILAGLGSGVWWLIQSAPVIWSAASTAVADAANHVTVEFTGAAPWSWILAGLFAVAFVVLLVVPPKEN